jgi:hypothetical protein
MSESAQVVQVAVICSVDDLQPPPPHYEQYMAKEVELANGNHAGILNSKNYLTNTGIQK